MKKILIVEDEAILAGYLADCLNELNYHPSRIVNSGEQALYALDLDRPDLVLMDIKLKGALDGIQTAREIKKRSDTPVVFLAAQADEPFLERAKITEPFGYLIKPVEIRDLHAAIEIALNKNKVETELRRAELAIHLIKQEWEQTFDAFPDLMAIIDVDHRVIRANKALAARTGFEPEDLIGVDCYHLFHGTAEPPDYCLFSRLVSEAGPQQQEIHEPALGGSFLLSCAPLFNQEGKLSGTVHVARDITDRKQLELERERLISELNEALNQVETLKDLLPFCANCGQIRSDQGSRQRIEQNAQDPARTLISRSPCPDCDEKT